MSARILIIDDNSANLELMRYLLEAFGHQPFVAEDGRQGVDAARREPPDLILCDVQMWDVDGYEVVRRLRADPTLAKLPVVAVTALAMVGDREKVLGAGFNGYLPKPIDPASFARQVERFLPADLRSTAPVDAVVASAPSPTASASGPVILVIDNVAIHLELIKSLFGSFGYRVVATTESASAIDLAHEHAPDLVLSDVCMPNGGGFDLIRAFKADPVLRAIPFVFITSTAADAESRYKGLALGATKFLFRPIDPGQLLKEVEECLPPGKEG